MNWIDEIVGNILKERPDEEIYTVASGISPSGYVHIGNFKEIATPYLIAKRLKELGKNVRYILSFDDYDRLRKVPKNINSDYDKYIGMPYTKVPSFVSGYDSYADYMEKRFINELKLMGVSVEYIFQTKKYKNGSYKDFVKLALGKRHEIFDIIASFRTQESTEEEKENYYPINIYCDKCFKDSTKVTSLNGDLVEYTCACGHKGVININESTNYKLPWKIDWPMRWKYEGVTIEAGGADHSASNGSIAVARRISKEIFDYEAPFYIPYNFIGIKGAGGKMSSSLGNVLTITDLLKVYDENIIWWFYNRFEPMHAYDISLDNDVVRYYSEFDRWVKALYLDKIDNKNKGLVRLTGVNESYLNNVGFNILCALLPIVNNDKKLLKTLLEKNGEYIFNDEFEKRIDRAIYWLLNYGMEYQINPLENKNEEFYETLNEIEKTWLLKTKKITQENFSSADELQRVLYDVVKSDDLTDKELKINQKRYFNILYNMLIGKNEGPKLGIYFIALGKEKINKLL